MDADPHATTWNYTLLGNNDLGGFGGLGEGIGIQLARDGRRILWLAHESAPKNFTGLDVTDPRNPKMIVQTDLPHAQMRSNSLEVVGDMMAVAYQTSQPGLTPAGFELFDISTPEQPKSITRFDASGPHSRGVHQLWFCDGEYIHLSGGAADFTPKVANDDQFYRIIDVRSPSTPKEVGRWWLPGTRDTDNEPAPPRLPAPHNAGYRAHNTNSYPQRPDRTYVAYVDGGFAILDIADKSAPKMIAHWNHSPPFNGFTHTVLPLFGRDLLVVSDECIKDGGGDWPKLVWLFAAKAESNPVPIATLPLPPVDVFAKRGGRFGAHNLHENNPGPLAWRSEDFIVGAFFNGGLRAYDISNPFQPKEVAWFVPPAPKGSRAGAIQINDCYVDERGITYAVDRFTGGLYTLEANF
jgi:hypothetical protein